jgi:hypothetical protein
MLARLQAFLAVLVLALPGLAQEPPAPRPVPPKPPDGLVLTITGPDRIDPHTIGVFKLPDAGQVILDAVDGLSVEQRGSELLVTGKPGKKYTLSGMWIDFDARKASRISKTFSIGDPAPPPPPPPPPGPVDPLAAELRLVYAADASPTKEADLAVLGEVYKLMAGEAVKSTYATADAINARYRSTVEAAVGTRLMAIRGRCAREIEAAVGDPDAALTDDARKKIAAAFTRLAAVLPQVAH